MKSIKRSGLLLAALLIAVLAMTSMVMARESESATQTQTENGDALAIALAHLEQNKAFLGLTDADLKEYTVQWQYTSQHNGVTHIILGQRHAGIAVWQGDIRINVARDGSIINVHNQFISDLAGKVNGSTPELTAVAAVEAAAQHLGLAITEPLEVQESFGGPDRAVVLSNGGISMQPIPAKLMYQPQPTEKGQVRLVWDMEIEELNTINWWTMRVDAETGEVLSQLNRVADDSYNVYPVPEESPYFSVPPAPADGRTLELNPADANGSPFGWHDTNGAAGVEFTTTQGNNVHAYTDVDANNVPDAGSSPDGGPTLVFNFPLDLTLQPSTYRPAAVSNLFYWNNVIHDVFYEYGFDEAAGNFQENNYGNGGVASDYVQAEAQDGSGTCNANFGTPGDGGNPRMQMYICENGGGAPAHDGDLDNLVIVHEYGHGISNRLNDPVSASCLGNAEQMGEGWSDFWGTWMTMETGDTGATPRAVGTYLFEQGPGGAGIRPAPYSTDFGVNGFTYGDLPPLAVPHGVGFLWATMIWDMNWALIDEYGFNSDIYADWTTGGNNLANQLVVDGLTLQPCNPGFVDGRDAILAADVALTGGVNQCTIWQAFANRGLGFSASQGSSASTADGTEAFDMPPACLTLNIPISSADICQGDTAVYSIGVGIAFAPPVAMSATGNPAPSTAVFTPNPINTVPDTTSLTIGNTAAVATGSYTINIAATGGAVSDNADVTLNVFAAAPAAPTLVSPANGATDIGTLPTLSWNAVANATSYLVEIADDIGFTNIVYSANEPSTSHDVTTALYPNTLYYWRVQPQNPCGSGSYSATFSFTTADLTVLLVDDDDNAPDVLATYTNALDNLGVPYNVWDTANSDNEPSAAQLAPYDTVIWFTGVEFGGAAGPGAAGEAALGTWLNSNHCLFISSQDYHYDRGLTLFMQTYLGVASATDDNGNYTAVNGQGTVFGGLGPYTLAYPFADFSDIVNPNGTAETAFRGTNLNNGAVNKDNGYHTTFWGFPWEAISTAANREQAMQTVLDWCSPDFTLTPTPPTQTICQPTDAVYTIDVDQVLAFSEAVTLSTSGLPAGLTSNFSANNLPPTYSSTLTIGNTAVATPGNYTFDVVGTAVSTVHTVTLGLDIGAGVPTAPTLLSPANGATNTSLTPTLVWTAVPGAASYTIQVDDDPGFGSVDYTAVTAATSHTVATPLTANTIYYWRIQASNGCGSSVFSAAHTFQTAAITCTVYPSTNVPLRIPPAGTAGTTNSVLNIATGGTILDMNVLNLAGTHTWMGDLDFFLERPGTSVQLYENTSCGNVDNFNINFDDEAASGTHPCPPTDGLTYQPVGNLTDFDGQDQAGTWTLRIVDSAAGDFGFLNSWSLEICTGGTASNTAVWDGGGITNDWSEAANWVGDVVPQATDTVLFDTTSTKDSLLDAAFPGTLANIVINSGYTGTITMDRSFAVTGDYTQVDGVFVVSDPATAVMTVGGNMTHTSGSLRQTQPVNGTAISFLQIEDGAAVVKYRGANLDATTSGSNLGAVTVNVLAVDRVTEFCTETGAMSGPYAGRCFDVTPTTTGTAMLRLYALTSELPGGPFNPAVYHDITSTGNWVQLTTNAATGTTGAYTYAEAEATGFSPFLIGDVVESPTAVTLTKLSIDTPSTLPVIAVLLILLLMFTAMLYRAKRNRS